MTEDGTGLPPVDVEWPTLGRRAEALRYLETLIAGTDTARLKPRAF